MNVAGIDVSTYAIDLVLLDMDTDRATWHRYELEGADLIERVRRVRHWDFAGWDDIVAVGVERPAGHYGVAQTSMAFGAVLARLPGGLLVQPWQPSGWRKACGLKGNATKADVADIVTGWCGPHAKIGPGHGWPQDACDAYCIAWATRSVLEQVAA